jgi:integrase
MMRQAQAQAQIQVSDLQEQKPFRLFLNSIKSEKTRQQYVLYFRKYMEIQGISIDDILNVKDADSKQIEEQIIDFIMDMKDENKSFSAIHNYKSAIIAFYKINDVVLNVTKINKFMPEQHRLKKDRAYEREEIGKLLEIADERFRAVILLLASTGMRIGAVKSLRLRNLEKIPENNIYKVTVYEGDKEEYFSFTTPEATEAIDEYLEMRKRYGEPLNKNSFLIREQFDVRSRLKIESPSRLKSMTLTKKLMDLGERAGIRVNSKDYASRHDVAISHGFRKYFTTELIKSDVKAEARLMLEGHSIGITDHYWRPSSQDILGEYMKAVNNLTINEENRLKLKIEKLEVEKTDFQALASEIAEIKRELRIKNKLC